MPQSAKHCPSNDDMLHNMNPIVIDTVLPERMEPSQMIPSLDSSPGLFHHVSVRSCRLLKFRYIIKTDLPRRALTDRREKGKGDERYTVLADIVDAHRGLWCPEAEEYLLANF